MVYKLLGKLKAQGELQGCEVVILHRGAPRDRKSVPGGRITEVKKSYFSYRNEVGEETTIPYHRVLEVRVGRKAVWEKGK